MDNNNPSTSSGHGNNFFGGFLLGLIVGAAVVFLLGTKKGKRVWKAISEDGIDNISNLLEKAEQTENLDEVIEEDEVHVTPKIEFAIKEKSVEEKPKVRRFFRGISRRVN